MNKRRNVRRWAVLLFLVVTVLPAAAQSDSSIRASIAEIVRGIDTVWVLFAAFLVFLMQAGFGMLEAGLIRAKNTSNILMKNLADFCMASLGFLLFGYAIMFGSGNGLFGTTGWFLIGAESGADVPLFAFWLFQAVFCGAAATIVAGGVAERMRFPAYLSYSFLISAFIYPTIGHWIWGGGWLAQMGFTDFAGSTVVHATGGWAAFVGTAMLGPRVDKYKPDGTPNVLHAHSVPLACLGMFLLWFGWFGFNPGSTLGVGDGSLIARVAINTNLAAATGGLVTMATVWIVVGKPDFTMTMNGCLAGLVAITAPCAFVDPVSAIAIGAVGGVIVVLGVFGLDRIRIDDPVGAVAVHGMNGIWGTISLGIFGRAALGTPYEGLLYGGGLRAVGVQTLGTLSVTLFVLVVMFVVFKVIDVLVGLRVTRSDEIKGLDLTEHGAESYGGFQVFITE